MKRCLYKPLLLISGLALSSSLFASGFRLEFQSASVLADAGEAAVVEDAGTNWYNSAGLVYIPHQLALSTIDVYAPTRFSGTASAPSTVLPIPPFNYLATGRASAHTNSILPGFNYALPIQNNLALGLTIAPAWGFIEDYGENSLVRYNLTRVYTRTLDIAPSVAFRFNDHWSLGLGPDFHYFYVSSKAHVNTIPLTASDSTTRFSANDWASGAHIGLLYRIDPATRIGLNYRTRMTMDLDGHSDFVLTGIAGFGTRNFKLKIPLPSTTTLSAYHDFSPRWALMGTVSYDQWNVLKHYHARNVAQPGLPIPDVIQVQDMRDTVDVGVGTHYRWNDCWLFRASIKYEPTPTISAYRDVNFPDGRKLGFQIGGRYQYNKNIALDFIYGHVFVKTVDINGTNALTGASLSGHQRTKVDLAGAQLVWTI